MNVFIKAYMAFNLGDDLFIKVLLDRYPETDFHLSAPAAYKNVFGNYSNLHISEISGMWSWSNFIRRVEGRILRKTSSSMYRHFQRRLLRRKIEAFAEKSDAFVSIGGSIFMQPTQRPVYSDIEYYNAIVNRYFVNKKKIVIGSNFGPYEDPEYLNAYRKIFSKMDDVCFREQFSADLFKHLPQVRTAPDVVFNMDVQKNKGEKIKQSIGFSIVSLKYKSKTIHPADYYQQYAGIINFFIKRGYKITLFSFCKHEGDETAIHNIFPLLEGSVEWVFYNGDIDNFLCAYSKMESMFCGRFHAMILSLLFSQNIFPVIYSNKMSNVLNDLHYTGGSILLHKLGNTNCKAVEAQFASGKNTIGIEEIKKSAGNNFVNLDKLLLP